MAEAAAMELGCARTQPHHAAVQCNTTRGSCRGGGGAVAKAAAAAAAAADDGEIAARR